MRLQVLKRDCYICQCDRCRKDEVIRPASQVDHIRPKAKGGTDDLDNLQAINGDCHLIKTDRDSGRQRRQSFDVHGNPIDE